MATRETTIGRYDFQPYISAEIYYDTRYGQFALSPDRRINLSAGRVARHRAVLRAPGRFRGLELRRRCGRADTAHLVLNRAQERKTTFARLLLIAALAALPGVADA